MKKNVSMSNEKLQVEDFHLLVPNDDDDDDFRSIFRCNQAGGDFAQDFSYSKCFMILGVCFLFFSPPL